MPALPNGESLTDTWFVPARGGLGESMEIQANTIVSKMAKRVGAEYRLLHVPDLLSEDAYQSLVQDQHIQEIVDVIRRCRVIIHGIVIFPPALAQVYGCSPWQLWISSCLGDSSDRNRLKLDSCTSSRAFASSFLQIPPRDGHPCSWLW